MQVVGIGLINLFLRSLLSRASEGAPRSTTDQHNLPFHLARSPPLYTSRVTAIHCRLLLIGALPHKNGEKYFDTEYVACLRTRAADTRRFEECHAVMAEIRNATLGNAARTPKQEAHFARETTQNQPVE